MSDNINTVEYWDKRFETNWIPAGGENQTRNFMNAIIENIPEEVKKDIVENKLSIVDYGCGIAEGLPILKSIFENSIISGVDFSNIAISINKERYPEFEFKNKLCQSDVIISSNVIEHIIDTMNFVKDMIDNSNKYIIILSPYNENVEPAVSTQEHISSITENNYPEAINDFTRVFIKNDIHTPAWLYGSQIIVVYKKNKIEPKTKNDIKIPRVKRSIKKK